MSSDVATPLSTGAARPIGLAPGAPAQAAGQDAAQYGSTKLYFWSRWSLAPRPRIRWTRAGLSVVERRWQNPDATSGDQLVVATCRSEHDFYLRLSAEAYTGLTSWIEATPSRVNSVT